VINEVVHDMEYLKVREQTMRNTNESTNERVKMFAVLSSMSLILKCAYHRLCVNGLDGLADYVSAKLL